MKERLFSLLSVSLLVLILASAGAAQNQVTVQDRINAPIQYFGTYKVVTGEWSHGGLRAGPRVLYNCKSPGNYYSAVGSTATTAADQEWIDEGIMPDVSAFADIEQINGFDFGYCSTDLEPLGNQCAISITLYDDYIPCSTPLSAPTCAYTITGLPCSLSGNIECWAVSVDLEGGAECTTDPNALFRTTGAVQDPLGNVNGNFGWGFTANPGLAGLNDTGPILSFPCPNPVSGCSSGSLQGNLNFFWWEDPTAIWTGCYWFGGVPWASFDMKMYGPSLCSYPYYGLNINTLSLRSTDFVPGTTVTWTVTGFTPGNTVYFIVGADDGSLLLPAGELLITLPFVLPPIPFPPGGVLSLTVPLGAPHAFTQAAETTGPPTAAALVAFSNAIFQS